MYAVVSPCMTFNVQFVYFKNNQHIFAFKELMLLSKLSTQ